jgi:hypothetical protein
MDLKVKDLYDDEAVAYLASEPKLRDIPSEISDLLSPECPVIFDTVLVLWPNDEHPPTAILVIGLLAAEKSRWQVRIMSGSTLPKLESTLPKLEQAVEQTLKAYARKVKKLGINFSYDDSFRFPRN